MLVKLKKIGNSKGIILPRKVMEICEIESEVNLSIENKHIIISRVNSPRADWELRFRKAIDEGELPENDFSQAISNKFDESEWTW